jgi:hypothetical protein
VAESRQFGSPKILRFGEKTAGNGGQCAECEARLADALDGTLTVEEQKLFEEHTAHCGPCSQMLADARRGAAWLEMLRAPRPEPPAELLERILAETSGAQGFANPGRVVSEQADAAASYGNVVPFRRRLVSTMRRSSFGQIVFQPRFAMTAAMAFFSIALTMNLTGVRLLDLRASDLRPSSLKRDYHDANARVVRYYEGLRVVYELESRVHDFEGATDNNLPAAGRSLPSNPGQPAVQAPSGSGGQKASPPADGTQPERKRPAANPGTSRREDLNPSHRLVAASRSGRGFGNPIHAHTERGMA